MALGDDAIRRANAAFLADPEAQARARENGERWRRIREAELAAGPHAAVLPVATMRDVVALLEGREVESPFGADAMRTLARQALEAAEGRDG